MATYVMSDLHGCYDLYQKMLETIDFSPEDFLIILGDIFDRGPEPLKILHDVMARDNVSVIMGNHESMGLVCLPRLVTEKVDDIASESKESLSFLMDYELWEENGASTTINDFAALTPAERNDVIDFLENDLLPYDIQQVGDKIFVLVHAGIYEYTPEKDLDEYPIDNFLWKRPDFNKPLFENENIYVIVGHTPTPLIEQQMGLPMEGNIIHTNRYICIDCGAVYGYKLGCLCLETMEEFYVY